MKKSPPLKKAFTLVELLVVIAILGALMAALVTYTRSAIRNTEVAKCQEYLQQVQTALVVYYQDANAWPESLVNNNRKANGLDAEAAFVLHEKLKLTVSSDGQRLDGSDKFGLLSTWAQKVVKENGTSCSLGTHVPIGGTIADHRLRYALKMDPDKNRIENVTPSESIPGAKGEPTVDIRAEAVVWCYGPDGEIVHSWHDSLTKGAK